MKKLNIYLVTWKEQNDYDQWDSFVVVAKTEDIARNTLPVGGPFNIHVSFSGWAKNTEDIQVELIGVANKDIDEGRIICASYNAG